MSAPKFKIGDRVKWKDGEGRARSGNIVDAPFGYAISPATRYVSEAPELPPGRWHESHLLPDVPLPKKYATDLESQLGAEIVNLTQMVLAQRKALTEASAETERLERMAAMQAKGRMEDRDQIERLQRIGNKQVEACTHMSNRLTEEIGGRVRERIAKEAAQKELAQRKENELWCCDKLSELANELSAERVAKKSAQKELAEANDKIDRRNRWLAEANAKMKRLKSLVGEM